MTTVHVNDTNLHRHRVPLFNCDSLPGSLSVILSLYNPIHHDHGMVHVDMSSITIARAPFLFVTITGDYSYIYKNMSTNLHMSAILILCFIVCELWFIKCYKTFTIFSFSMAESEVQCLDVLNYSINLYIVIEAQCKKTNNMLQSMFSITGHVVHSK